MCCCLEHTQAEEKIAELEKELADREVYTKEMERASANAIKELSDLKANKGMLKSHGEVMVTMPNEEYKAIKQELADLKAEYEKLLRKARVLAKDSEDYYTLKQLVGEERELRHRLDMAVPSNLNCTEYYEEWKIVEDKLKQAFGNMLILHEKGGDDMGSNEFLWNKFYMCLTRSGKGTTKRHATLENAKEEAERLCHQEECEVAILTVTDICTPERPPITWTKPKEK